MHLECTAGDPRHGRAHRHCAREDEEDGNAPAPLQGDVYNVANCVYQRMIDLDESEACSDDRTGALTEAVVALDWPKSHEEQE